MQFASSDSLPASPALLYTWLLSPPLIPPFIYNPLLLLQRPT